MSVLAKQQESGLLVASETSIGNLLVELFYINQVCLYIKLRIHGIKYKESIKM